MAKHQPNRSLSRRPKKLVSTTSTDRLLGDIRGLIEAARQQVARTVNSGMVALARQAQDQLPIPQPANPDKPPSATSRKRKWTSVVSYDEILKWVVTPIWKVS